MLVGYLFISSLEKCVFDTFAHFLIRMFPCLMLNFTSYVYMLNSNLLLIIYKFFSHSVNCLFILSVVSLALQKLLSLSRSHFFTFAFISFKRWIQRNIATIYVKECSAYVFV